MYYEYDYKNGGFGNKLITLPIYDNEFKRGCICNQCEKYPCDMSFSHVCKNCKDGAGRTSGCIYFVRSLFERRTEDMCEVIDGAIKDSGNRTKFESGAVRDMADGKGRMDLMPIESICKLFCGNDKVLNCFEDYNKTKDPIWFLNAVDAFIPHYYDNYPDTKLGTRGFFPPVLLDVSIHFEEGAKKYGENNWQKGIPLSSYIDSGMRHYFKHCSGMVDEHHNRAFVWNMLCGYWTAINKK